MASQPEEWGWRSRPAPGGLERKQVVPVPLPSTAGRSGKVFWCSLAVRRASGAETWVVRGRAGGQKMRHGAKVILWQDIRMSASASALPVCTPYKQSLLHSTELDGQQCSSGRPIA